MGFDKLAKIIGFEVTDEDLFTIEKFSESYSANMESAILKASIKKMLREYVTAKSLIKDSVK